VDVGVFHPLAEPLALRRRWSRRLGARLRPTDFVLVSRDTNQWRKQLPLLLDALARLPRDVKLILHCRPAAHPDARGWDLEHLAKRVYGVADRVAFTGRGKQRPALSPRELAELDNLADLRVAATQGEGFGILTIEAMACGTPTVITDYTTSRELMMGIADCRLPIADWKRRGTRPGAPIGNRESGIGNHLDDFGDAGELVRVAAWTVEQDRHLLRPVIDPADLAAKVLALRDDPGRLARCAEAGLRRVLARYTTRHVARAWVCLARQVLAERSQMRGEPS
jgi:glycosyltransferase involved in cell wall biosynthesis